MHSDKLFLLLIPLLLLSGCTQNNSPKPRGYFRIDLPEKAYRQSDTAYPFFFEYPEYDSILPDPYSRRKYWINLEMPQFEATLHFSYKIIDGNLANYLEDSHTLVSKHIPKADAIYDSLIIDPQRNVYGLTYRIIGSEAASPYQFFLTDSSKHFLRGALYFNTIPNNDSLQPVIDFIVDDIEHIINTLQWK
jgi:gliding motility-associated lipoprotein GldD